MTVGAPLPDGATVLSSDELPSAPTTTEPIGIVVLAAGTSSRYGERNKLLCELDGEPIVARVARTAVEADAGDAVAVLGHEADAVAEALPDDVPTIRNERYRAGQSTSVRAGVRRAVEREWDAVAFLPGDVPLVSPATVTDVVGAYHTGDWRVVIAAYGDRRGHPVVFGASCFDDLLDLTGDRGGRPLFREYSRVAVVDTGDPGVVSDVDTPDDLRRLKNRD